MPKGDGLSSHRQVELGNAGLQYQAVGTHRPPQLIAAIQGPRQVHGFWQGARIAGAQGTGASDHLRGHRSAGAMGHQAECTLARGKASFEDQPRVQDASTRRILGHEHMLIGNVGKKEGLDLAAKLKVEGALGAGLRNGKHHGGGKQRESHYRLSAWSVNIESGISMSNSIAS